MTVSVANFRQNFPEFVSVTTYPDAMVQFWLDIAYVMLNPTRWATALDYGIQLFVAHNLVLEAQAQKAAANGGIPGLAQGAVSSKSVDKVSVSYDVGSGAELAAGHWNLTNYGRRFIHIAMMMGAGPVQIGTPYGSDQPLLMAGAWTGPWTWQIPNPAP